MWLPSLSADCKKLIDFVLIQPQYIRLDGLIMKWGGGWDLLKHF